APSARACGLPVWPNPQHTSRPGEKAGRRRPMPQVVASGAPERKRTLWGARYHSPLQQNQHHGRGVVRLNSIKLSGFKSFAEPTNFLLPGQLVGVVGPNGCGKSNIMDAVRWV